MTEKILFVDDDSNLLASYQRQLRGKYTIDTSPDGQQGLESISSRGPYTVIVSDYRMPGMNGVQFLSRLEKGRRTRYACYSLVMRTCRHLLRR